MGVLRRVFACVTRPFAGSFSFSPVFRIEKLKQMNWNLLRREDCLVSCATRLFFCKKKRVTETLCHCNIEGLLYFIWFSVISLFFAPLAHFSSIVLGTLKNYNTPLPLYVMKPVSFILLSVSLIIYALMRFSRRGRFLFVLPVPVLNNFLGMNTFLFFSACNPFIIPIEHFFQCSIETFSTWKMFFCRLLFSFHLIVSLHIIGL